MNLLTSILIIFSCLLVLMQIVTCQFPQDFPTFFNDFPSIEVTRDPRENRGPVVFPPASIPPDTSGVRVGASGFGFVPPSMQRGSGFRTFRGGPNANEFPFW